MMDRDTGTVPEELEQLTLWTSRFRTTAGMLVAIGLLCFAMFVVLLCLPETRNAWVFAIPAAVFGGLGIRLWARRRRTLRIIRVDGSTKLVVDGEAALTFPLKASGTQFTMRLRGVPMHYVSLRLVDGSGRAVALVEVRSALQGPVAGWYDDAEPAATKEASTKEAYEATGGNKLTALRSRVAKLNQGLGAGG
jgi:hypothetical protein